jgi:hypothetical protein
VSVNFGYQRHRGQLPLHVGAPSSRNLYAGCRILSAVLMGAGRALEGRCLYSPVTRDRVRFDLPLAEMAVSRLERAAYPPFGLRSRARLWQRVYHAFAATFYAGQLDRQLAGGASPGASAVLAIHAERITGGRSRARVADGLARVRRDAQVAQPGFTAAIRPHRSEVIAARVVLEILERRLRAPEPVTARGVALLRVLLTDGASPLYRPGDLGALGSDLRAAAAALERVAGLDERVAT